jgi:hypothetical protein
VPPLLLFVASLKLTLGLHLHKRGGASSMVMEAFRMVISLPLSTFLLQKLSYRNISQEMCVM